MTSNQSIDDWTMATAADTTAADSFVNVEKEVMEVLKLSVTPKVESIGIQCPHDSTQACVTIRACEVPDDYDEKRSSVDLIVSLDISGSMSGAKLKDCISTLKSMLRPLGPKDRFGLVTFGSEAKVIIPSKFMTKENKASALLKIKALRTSGQTNLSGGLTLAWQEMMLIENPNAVRSVFLLTDGQANVGVTSTPALVSMVKSFNVAPPVPNEAPSADMNVDESDSKIPAAITLDNTKAPISLFCFGYGSGHNSEMLQAISEATPGGAYYFVEKDTDVSSAFGDAMGGLLSVLAQSAVLKITVPPAAAAMGVKISDVHHDEKIARGDGSYTVSLGDFYAEESRDVLFDVTLANTSSDDPIPHVQISLSYMDIMNKKHAQAGPVDCSIKRPLDSEASPVNLYVESQWVRVFVVREMEAADLLAQQRQLETAQARLKGAQDVITKSAAYGSDDGLMTALQEDVKEVSNRFSSYRTYGAGGGHEAKTKLRAYKQQRCMASAPAKQSRDVYKTKTKAKMAKAFASAKKDDDEE